MIFRYKIKFISDIEQKIRKLLVNIAVTPFVGVWIEIILSLTLFHIARSLPSWECGLKSLPHDQLHTSELSLPSWECGLKLANKLEEKTNGGHSLRGSVD